MADSTPASFLRGLGRAVRGTDLVTVERLDEKYWTTVADLIGWQNPSVDRDITAHPGGGKALATKLTGGLNFISNVGADGDSVELPDGVPGQSISVTNEHPIHFVTMFAPGTAGRFKAYQPDVGFDLYPGQTAELRFRDALTVFGGVTSKFNNERDLEMVDTAYTASFFFTATAGAYLGGRIIGASTPVNFLDRNGNAPLAGSVMRVLSSRLMIVPVAGAVPAGQSSFDLRMYTVTQPSAQADNTLWTLAAVDRTAYRGRIDLGQPTDLGAVLEVTQPFVDLTLPLVGQSAWARLITVGAFTSEAIDYYVDLVANAVTSVAT